MRWQGKTNEQIPHRNNGGDSRHKREVGSRTEREEKEIAFRAEEKRVTWKFIPIAGRGWAVQSGTHC